MYQSVIRIDSNELRYRLSRFYLYLLTFFIVFISDSLVFEINSNYAAIAFKRYSVIAVAFLLIFHHVIIQKKKITIHILLLTLFPICSSLVSGYLLNGFYYYSFIACIWIGLLFADKYSLEEFAEVFCIIMRFVCITSVVCYLFRDSLVNATIFPIVNSAKGNSYRWLGVISIPLKVSQRGRNFGPFWEPGTYQIYTNMALFLSLFVLKKNRKAIDALIFTLTGFSTLSGSLLIPMLLIYAAYALDNRNVKTFVGIIIVAALFVVFVYAGYFDNTFAKMMGTDSHSSMYHRLIALECGIRGFIHNPLLGSSPQYNDAMREQLAWKYLSNSYASSTNTIANIFGYFGVYVGGYIVVSSYKMFNSIGKNRIITILLFLSFVISTSNENLTTSTFFITFCMLRSGIRTLAAEETDDTGKLEDQKDADNVLITEG